MKKFPSPRPSPNGRGSTNHCAALLGCARFSALNGCGGHQACSLSQWERVRVRGIHLAKPHTGLESPPKSPLPRPSSNRRGGIHPTPTIGTETASGRR